MKLADVKPNQYFQFIDIQFGDEEPSPYFRKDGSAFLAPFSMVVEMGKIEVEQYEDTQEVKVVDFSTVVVATRLLLEKQRLLEAKQAIKKQRKSIEGWELVLWSSEAIADTIGADLHPGIDKQIAAIVERTANGFKVLVTNRYIIHPHDGSITVYANDGTHYKSKLGQWCLATGASEHLHIHEDIIDKLEVGVIGIEAWDI